MCLLPSKTPECFYFFVLEVRSTGVGLLNEGVKEAAIYKLKFKGICLCAQINIILILILMSSEILLALICDYVIKSL